MKLRQIIQRFLIPGFVISLIYFIRYRCTVSPRAEVELSPNLRIGRGTLVSSFVKIKATNGDLIIGNHATIATGCFIAADAGAVTIGDHAIIGPNVCIVGVNYRYDRLDVPIALQGGTSKGIRIGNDVWIGAGTVIIDGAHIGDHCIVKTNSVVSGTLEPNTIAQGQPARPVSVRS
ncbi:acyltransferase [Salinisphaera sp.]|uniref:acyltransferase n=1 Tax=Salinisphaera sp. TaxID=1914330 RepID=UPI002D794347|nr:acyltransferase [Salinisphaera sp.]HET7314094.1 acyltransferase [Salinisphaera sp.]